MAASYADLEGLWIKAGGSSASAPIAAAIAMAESGGNPNSINNNPKTGDLSYGYWQINMIGSLGPSRRRQFGITSNTQLLDPLTNAKAAVMLSNGGSNFTPWSTFKSGAFRNFMNGSVPPNLASGGTPSGGAPAQTVGFQSDVITPIVDNVENMLNYAFMSGLVLLGVILMLGAVWSMIRESSAVSGGRSVGGAIVDVTLIRALRRNRQ